MLAAQEKKGTTWGVAFNDNGRILVCDSDHFTIRIWDVVTGKCMRTFMEKGHSIYSLAFSPDGLTLATGNSNRQVILWDLASIVNAKP